jgi:hypothetical protein
MGGVAGALAGRHGRKVKSGRLRGVRLIFEGLTSRPGVRCGSPSRGGRGRPEPAAHSRSRKPSATVLGLPVARARPGNVPGAVVGVVSVKGGSPQQNAASSRAQAIAMTPAGSRRSSCGCAQRWCRRCLARRAWLGSDAGSAASGRHHPQRWTAGPGCGEPLPACGSTIGTVPCSIPHAQRQRRASRALDAMLTSDPSR